MGIGVVVYSATNLSSVPDRVPEDRKAEEMAFRTAVADVIQELRGGSKIFAFFSP